MAFVFKIICFTAFVQTITCQGIGNVLNPGFNNGAPFPSNLANSLSGPALGFGSGGQGLAAGPLRNSLEGSANVQSCSSSGQSTGGGFAVTSSSPIAPTGVSILAENLAIEGPLSVGGQLPFLGSVGVEGTLPASGSGSVSYACGSGDVGITSSLGAYGTAGQNGPTASQYGSGLAGYGMAGQGIGAGLAGYNNGIVGAGLNGPGWAGNGLAGFGHLGGSGIASAAPK